MGGGGEIVRWKYIERVRIILTLNYTIIDHKEADVRFYSSHDDIWADTVMCFHGYATDLW